MTEPKIEKVPLGGSYLDKLRAVFIDFIPAEQCITCITQEGCWAKNCPCTICHGGPGFNGHPDHLPDSFYAMLHREYPPEGSRPHSPASKQEDAT